MGDLLLVRCSNCGICCEDTVMELSSKDIEKIVDKGYRVEEFTDLDKGVTRLKNVNGYCYFYNHVDKKCKIYENRPIGCYLYPVVYLENECAIVDELCPRGHTISEQELRTKGKILDKFLKKIESERKISKQCNHG